jgi:hypothetical protein
VAAAHQVGVVPPDRPRSLSDDSAAAANAAWFKARFFAMARGSAMECAAVLDVLRATGIVPGTTCVRGRSLLVRIVQMHTRLCLRVKA